MQAGEVPCQFDGHSAPGSERLEDGVAELKSTVVDGQVRSVRRHEPAVEPDVGRGRQGH